MQSSKLYELLKTFSATERSEFEVFLASPYFTTSKSSRELFTELLPYLEEKKPADQLVLANIFKKIYPKRAYSVRSGHHLTHQLYQLAEQFCAQHLYDKDTAAGDRYLLQSLRKRRLDKAFAHAFKRAKRRAPATHTSPQACYQYFTLIDEAARGFTETRSRKPHPYLDAAESALDHFYVRQKSAYQCQMLSRQQVLGETFPLEDLQWVRNKCSNGAYPEFALYHYALATLVDSTPEEDFFALCELLQVPERTVSDREYIDLFFVAINFCINKIRSGETAFAAYLMDLYVVGLEREVLLESGQLNPWTYKNISKLGLGLGRTDWVAHFIENYTRYLPKEMRQDAEAYNLADLHYHRREYDQAQGYLNQVTFSDPHYALGARVMLIKIFYEQNAFDALYALLASFQVYLSRRKDISRSVKLPYLNFVKILSQWEREGKASDALRERIHNTPSLTDRSWLKEQVG